MRWAARPAMDKAISRTAPVRNMRLDGLAKDIKQTAFPMALEIGEGLKQQGYKPYFNHHYIDPAELKDHEIDLLATKGHLVGAANAPIYLIDTLYAEVEEGGSPWIIFTSARTDSDHESLEFFAFEALSGGLTATLNNFGQTQQLADQPWIGRYCCTVSEDMLNAARGGLPLASSAFSRDEDGEPFGAMLSCAKASIGIKLTKPRTAWADTGTMWSITKLVVFDGPLYEAHRSGQDIEIAESNYIPFVLNFSSPAHVLFTFVVHIVRHAYFPAFLKRHQSWISQVSEEVDRRTGA
jgi:hypothetical protein